MTKPKAGSDADRLRYDGPTDGVAILSLNRPDKRNAIDPLMLAELSVALDRAEADPGVRVILLRAEGKDFCAGMDIGHLEATLAYSYDELLDDARQLGDLLIRMRGCARPIVAAVHGNALAGGAGLATACDLVLATEDAHFGYPEVHLGFVPAIVMNLLVRAVGEKEAFELVARGDRIDAKEACRLGLVNRLFSRHTFDDDALAYCVELAQRPPTSITLSKRLLYELHRLDFAEGVARGAEINARARQDEAFRDGVRAFLERKRPPAS